MPSKKLQRPVDDMEQSKFLLDSNDDVAVRMTDGKTNKEITEIKELLANMNDQMARMLNHLREITGIESEAGEDF